MNSEKIENFRSAKNPKGFFSVLKKANILLLSLIFSFLFLFSGCSTKENNPTNPTSIRFLNEEREAMKISVEIADTMYKQTIGLMNREKLDEDKGMLFIFNDEKPREFWMKNTLIPLDMIFLDKNFKIVKILENAQPCKTIDCDIYSSILPAQYVIEVNGGFSKKYNITNQTIVVWNK